MTSADTDRPRPAGVLLHGFSGAPASWDEVRTMLATPERWLAPALPGHAGSAAPANLGFETVGQILVERAAAKRPCLWVGYSLGARLCCAVLAARPELVSGLVLIGVNPGLSDPSARAERRSWEAGWLERMERGLETFVEAWEALPLFASQHDLPSATRRQQAAIRRSHAIADLARAFDAMALSRMPDYRSLLARAAVPICLVSGERDEKFRRLAGELVPDLAHGELRIVAGAGHNPVLEQPRAVATLIDELAEPSIRP